jgi:putative tryptophan/tyrosine transport system substrate-binding protein
MRRREFITLLSGAAAWWPRAAKAQQPRRVWRIGWLSPGSGPGAFTQSFFQGMRERGYVEGENLAIEYRWAAGKDQEMIDLARDLVGKGVDLIVTVGTPATLAAKETTSTIPIVFAAAGAPVEKGLVKSLHHPGGNVTGLALITDDIKALQILKEVAPGISRVAFIYDPTTLPGRFGQTWLARARGRARTLKLDLQLIALQNPAETDQVFASLPPGTDALLVGNSATNANARRRICSLAAQRRLPAASVERGFTDAGCLMSYGEDQIVMHRRAAAYVDKIFKGAKIDELPVEQPTKFQLVINLKTAKTLGLEIPPTLLARADEVIE